jgi:hypothetical protein
MLLSLKHLSAADLSGKPPLSTQSGSSWSHGVGLLGAKSGHWSTARRTGEFDPERALKIGPMNAR